MICVNSKIFRYNIKKVMNNVTGDNMLFKKQKKKQQGVTIEENTQIFIEDFKKLVDEGKKESVRSVITSKEIVCEVLYFINKSFCVIVV